MLKRLRLVATDRVPTFARLAIEMPSIAIETAVRPGAGDVVVEPRGWGDDTMFITVDRDVQRSSSDGISVRGSSEEIERVAIEVLTRCQRFVDRRNVASATSLWDEVREAHASLHDLTKPRVAAYLDHAVDTWQWMLRLSPHASLAAQLAALFQDVGRLERSEHLDESGVERRVESDDVAYVRHAARGAELAYDVVRRSGVDAETAERVRAIVAARVRDPDVDLLRDAGSLSFFSLSSPGYADAFGPEQTRKMVAYTLARLRPDARCKLAGIRLRDDVQGHLVASLVTLEDGPG